MSRESDKILGSIGLHPDGDRVLEIADGLRATGGRAVLVGGAVRDGLLGSSVKDLDIEVFGLERDVFEACLGRFGDVMSVGRAFGVLRIRGLDVDFSLPRRDSKVAPGHRGFDVAFDPQLSYEAASRRRDLTVNSMGIDLASGQLLDPHGGRADLRAGVLRATDLGTFGEDPLRAVRVAQMSARFEMEVDPALVALCATFDLAELPGERLHEEFRKLLLKGREPSRGFAFLRECGLIAHFPELAALIDVAQDPVWHPEGDVWVHTLLSLDRAAALRGRAGEEVEAMMLGVLCHDLGKPVTTELIDGRIRSLAHDRKGVEPTLRFLERLRVSADLTKKVAALVEHHLAPALLVEQGAKPRAYRRLARKLDQAGVTMRLLECVTRADYFGRTTVDALAGRFAAGDTFLASADALSIETEGPADVVLGRHLIARGLEPSPEFSRILERCREIQDETGLADPVAILSRVLDR
ncbi:MAG: HD domain-containing protein [bacterium]|nr:HD domain-containing protein [bacterium]